jgi:hypothetical protein
LDWGFGRTGLRHRTVARRSQDITWLVGRTLDHALLLKVTQARFHHLGEVRAAALEAPSLDLLDELLGRERAFGASNLRVSKSRATAIVGREALA